MDIRREDWNTTLGNGEQYDVVYFNPPYLPYGEKVRDEMIGVPEEFIYVRDSEDGLDHYRSVLPKLRKVVKPGGLIVVRTPRDESRFMQIKAMAQDIFDDSEREFTIHSASITSELGTRNGKGLLIRAAAFQPVEYSMETIRHIGGYIVFKTDASNRKVFV